MLRVRSHRRDDEIRPCLPSPAERPPSGDGWLHEIKHDGMRIMAFSTRRRSSHSAPRALVPDRRGSDCYPNGDGLAVLDLIRRKRHGENAVLIAFDLIELDGEDLYAPGAAWQLVPLQDEPSTVE
jgi:hypothetical protein